jgi:hypothetical protein
MWAHGAPPQANEETLANPGPNPKPSFVTSLAEAA